MKYGKSMTFDEFIKLKGNVLLGYHLLFQWYPEKFKIAAPYPPSEISGDDLEVLKDRLDDCMPLDSMIVDLWDWDAHFEKDLGDDWYFEAVFGDENAIIPCATDLAEYFYDQVESFDINYDQYPNEDLFKEIILQESVSFIRRWREKTFEKFAQKAD